MKATPTRLAEVVLIEPTVLMDLRGHFMETYSKKFLDAHGIAVDFVQDNQSLSHRAGTLRGLHYQLSPCAQGKLVRCIRGAIFDVAVDIRRSSPTFKQWIGVVLSADNRKQLWVPPGFAHGFVTLEDDSELAYKVTVQYSKAHDRSILWSDPELAIDWNITNPILSEKDASAVLLERAELT